MFFCFPSQHKILNNKKQLKLTRKNLFYCGLPSEEGSPKLLKVSERFLCIHTQNISRDLALLLSIAEKLNEISFVSLEIFSLDDMESVCCWLRTYPHSREVLFQQVPVVTVSSEGQYIEIPY